MNNSPFTSIMERVFGLSFDVWFLVKIAILFGLFIFMAFSIMVVRQVGLMSRALNGSFAGPLKFFAWLYLVATVIVFLLALILL